MKHRLWIAGRRFGTLVAIRPTDEKRGKWECQCDCGQISRQKGSVLVAGLVVSCGCRRVTNPSRLTHGHAAGQKSPTYMSWLSIRNRCFNPKSNRFYAYGGRGISVCERWLVFESFLADMGERPAKSYSIERINNDGNYEPGNCAWIPKSDQSRNTSQNVRVTIGGETLCITDWARRNGISVATICKRLKRGWVAEVAVTAPSRSMGA